MSLGSALAIAMSGLRANQAALAIVSSNIANAQTPGYVTQRINQVETLTGDTGASVSVTGVNRELDQFIQAPLRSRCLPTEICCTRVRSRGTDRSRPDWRAE